jgi:hypothetical protein
MQPLDTRPVGMNFTFQLRPPGFLFKSLEAVRRVRANSVQNDADRFWDEAWRDLNIRQARLADEMRLAHARWFVDQASGLIRFERADGSKLCAPVQIIGLWNRDTEVFTWGWDHPGVHTRLCAAAERTRWFGERRGFAELTEPILKASERDAWRFTSAAMKINDAAGAYRGPTQGPVVFMTLDEPKLLH